MSKTANKKRLKRCVKKLRNQCVSVRGPVKVTVQCDAQNIYAISDQ